MSPEAFQGLLEAANIRIQYVDDRFVTGWGWRIPSTLWVGPFETDKDALQDCLRYLLDATVKSKQLFDILVKYEEMRRTQDPSLITRKRHELDQLVQEILQQDPKLAMGVDKHIQYFGEESSRPDETIQS
jgi:hypothetical protein